jgi:hypothetical protein
VNEFIYSKIAASLCSPNDYEMDDLVSEGLLKICRYKERYDPRHPNGKSYKNFCIMMAKQAIDKFIKRRGNDMLRQAHKFGVEIPIEIETYHNNKEAVKLVRKIARKDKTFKRIPSRKLTVRLTTAANDRYDYSPEKECISKEEYMTGLNKIKVASNPKHWRLFLNSGNMPQWIKRSLKRSI